MPSYINGNAAYSTEREMIDAQVIEWLTAGSGELNSDVDGYIQSMTPEEIAEDMLKEWPLDGVDDVSEVIDSIERAIDELTKRAIENINA